MLSGRGGARAPTATRQPGGDGVGERDVELGVARTHPRLDRDVDVRRLQGIDEPWRATTRKPPNGTRFRRSAQALHGITATTAVHLCFGYAAVIRGAKPTGYSFRSQLAGTLAQQISIEASQPKIDLGVLDLSDKVIVLGVIDLQDHPSVESVEVVEARIRRGLKRLPPRGSSPRPTAV